MAFKDPPAQSPHLPDFHHCTFQNCRLQLPPGVRYVPTPVLPYQHWPSGRGKKPLASPITPQISFMRDALFDVLFVRFRYGPSVCSPPVLTRPEELNVSPAFRGFYVRASSHRGTPITAGYHYGATLGTAPAGLSPASTAASLAALPPGALCCTPINSTTTRSATLVPAAPFPTHGYRSGLLGEVSSPGTEGFSG